MECISPVPSGEVAEVPMRIVSGVPKHTLWLVKHWPPELSSDAKRRLKWFEWNREHGGNVSRTCRHFDISRQTFYRWKRRYDPQHADYNGRHATAKTPRPPRGAS